MSDPRRVAGGTEIKRARALRRLRGELRRIARRDFFPPPERDAARAAVQALGAGLVELSPGRAPGAGRERA